MQVLVEAISAIFQRAIAVAAAKSPQKPLNGPKTSPLLRQRFPSSSPRSPPKAPSSSPLGCAAPCLVLPTHTSPPRPPSAPSSQLKPSHATRALLSTAYASVFRPAVCFLTLTSQLLDCPWSETLVAPLSHPLAANHSYATTSSWPWPKRPVRESATVSPLSAPTSRALRTQQAHACPSARPGAWPDLCALVLCSALLTYCASSGKWQVFRWRTPARRQRTGRRLQQWHPVRPRTST